MPKRLSLVSIPFDHLPRKLRERQNVSDAARPDAHLSTELVNFFRPLRISVVTAGVLISLATPRAAVSQEANIFGALSVDGVGTRLAGQNAFLVGGQVSLHWGSRVSVGGFGYGMPAAIRVVGGAIPEDLRLGYGGLSIGLTFPMRRSIGLQSSLLLGAGNAQLHAQPVGNQLGSDNFLVLEPRLTLLAPQGSRLKGRAGVGYRLVSGVQDLPRLTSSDLRGWTLTLSLSFGGPG